MAAYASTPPAKGSDADDTVLTGMHVSGCVVISCGHTFHSGCLESYCSTLLARQTAVGAHAMEMGEFPCPVCRRLSNCMLPLPEAGEVKVGTTLSSLDGAVGTVGMESVDDAVGCLGGASELWGALAVLFATQVIAGLGRIASGTGPWSVLFRGKSKVQSDV